MNCHISIVNTLCLWCSQSISHLIKCKVQSSTISIGKSTDPGCYSVFTSKIGHYQGSHSSWKTWKNGDSFSSLEKSWNFVIFAKYPGKMRQTLEIWGLLTVILYGNASPKTYQPRYTQHNIILTLHQSFLFYVYVLFNAGKMALCKLFLKLQL